ncbi:MAG: 23S rRNA (adenine(2503)-C(2))-methyltransferase RlmN [Acidobacteriota bacterium]|nr:MAG: 23S rRNA (adenine(2503)-C(2))-methyltransferase RlmN [Acidobacteriota bacterium]
MERASELRPNLYGLSRDELADALGPLAPERYRSRQLFRALYRRDAWRVETWTDLSRELREQIVNRFRCERPVIVSRHSSSDGATKHLLALPRGGRVEAVAIPAEDRMTFCISSQMGCAFGCTFCMTARLGFVRHLDAGEIVGQVAALAAETGARHGRYNIVFMGMGEPLHNADNVLRAVRLLTDPEGFAVGPRRITVSTVGLPAGIERLGAERLRPRLAVSLVSADEQTRARLMPVARAVSLEELARSVRRFGRGQRDRPTFEVVLLAGENDRPSHARALATLARRARAKVNLIEFNPTPDLPYRPAPEPRVQMFLRVLRAAGVIGTVRRSRGGDIDAACGQLAFTRQQA